MILGLVILLAVVLWGAFLTGVASFQGKLRDQARRDVRERRRL